MLGYALEELAPMTIDGLAAPWYIPDDRGHFTRRCCTSTLPAIARSMSAKPACGTSRATGCGRWAVAASCGAARTASRPGSRAPTWTSARGASSKPRCQRKNELVSSVLENLPCGLSVFDGELKLIASNGEFRRLLELPDSFDRPLDRFEDLIRYNAARGEYGTDIEATVTGHHRARKTARASTISSAPARTACRWRFAAGPCRVAASSPPTPTSARAARAMAEAHAQ